MRQRAYLNRTQSAHINFPSSDTHHIAREVTTTTNLARDEHPRLYLY